MRPVIVSAEKSSRTCTRRATIHLSYSVPQSICLPTSPRSLQEGPRCHTRVAGPDVLADTVPYSVHGDVSPHHEHPRLFRGKRKRHRCQGLPSRFLFAHDSTPPHVSCRIRVGLPTEASFSLSVSLEFEGTSAHPKREDRADRNERSSFFSHGPPLPSAPPLFTRGVDASCLLLVFIFQASKMLLG